MYIGSRGFARSIFCLYEFIEKSRIGLIYTCKNSAQWFPTDFDASLFNLLHEFFKVLSDRIVEICTM